MLGNIWLGMRLDMLVGGEDGVEEEGEEGAGGYSS